MPLDAIFSEGQVSSSPLLRVRLLGEPVVTYGPDDSLDVPLSQRCLLLLAYLALHRKTRRRERIAAALCPDAMENEARANLRRTLHQLLRALPKAATPWVLLDKHHMALSPAIPLWCDVEAFDRPRQDERALAHAVDLYGGDFIASEEAEWVVRWRSRLRDLQVEALTTLAESSVIRGDTKGATRYYRRLLALDPFHEDAVRSLIVLRSRQGDRAGAAIEYRNFTNRLAAELDIEPMPETVACYEKAMGERFDRRGFINFREIDIAFEPERRRRTEIEPNPRARLALGDQVNEFATSDRRPRKSTACISSPCARISSGNSSSSSKPGSTTRPSTISTKSIR